MLLLNLTVAAVIDGLQEAQSDGARLIKNEEIDQFKAKWSEYDIEGTGKISIIDCLFFISELKPPFVARDMRCMGYSDIYLMYDKKGFFLKWKTIFHIVREYNLKASRESDGNYYIEFKDVYKKIVKKTFENSSKSDFKLQSENLKRKLKSGWKHEHMEDKTQEAILQYIAVSVIETAYLKRKYNKQ